MSILIIAASQDFSDLLLFQIDTIDFTNGLALLWQNQS